MAFRTNPAPYQRSNRSTLKIMLILTISLVVVWIAAIVYSFILNKNIVSFVGEYNTTYAEAIASGEREALVNTNYGLRAILIPIVAVLVTACCDVVNTLLRHKKGSGKLTSEILHDLVHNYSYVTALILSLTLPVYTPFYVVIIGSIFATVVGKLIYGGFGKNIFNPAAIARIFIALAFGSQIALPEIVKLASFGIDTTTGATLTTAINNTHGWISTSYVAGEELIKGSVFAEYGLGSMLLGNYVGAMGETFTLLILAIGVVLSLLKVINWRTPVFYLGTVALSALVIGLICGVSHPFHYVLYHLSLGGLAFGAVFMLTDPVTGPTSPFGKSLMGILAGFLTVLIRIKGGYPEGVVFSIAICNIVSVFVDSLVVGKSNAHLVRKYVVCGSLLVLSIGLCGLISFKVNGGQERYEINGIGVVQYDALVEEMSLSGDDEYALADDYVIKNETNIQKAYYIVNKKKEKVAIVYRIELPGEIPLGEGYTRKVTSHTLVAINLIDDSIYGFGVIDGVCTNGFVSEDRLQEATSQYIGKDSTSYNDATVGLITGASEGTTPLLKKILATAYAEYGK